MPRCWLVIASALAAMTTLAACTVFSGWSDLQDGVRPIMRDARAPEGGGGDAEAGGADASIPPPRCGAAQCTAGLGCCLSGSPPYKLYCTTAAPCIEDFGTFMQCTDRTTCTEPGKSLCCLDEFDETATCKSQCVDEATLCSKSDPGGCFPGATCQTLSYGNSMMLSQCKP